MYAREISKLHSLSARSIAVLFSDVLLDVCTVGICRVKSPCFQVRFSGACLDVCTVDMLCVYQRVYLILIEKSSGLTLDVCTVELA